jgi:hypothetical protein
LRVCESNLAEQDIQLRDTVHDRFEMVGKHDDPVEQLVDEHSAFGVAGLGPHLAKVEIGEDREYFFKSLCELVLFGCCSIGVRTFRSSLFDLACQLGFFCSEEIGADLVCVVQLEQLAPPPGECSKSIRCSSWRTAPALAGLPPCALELPSNRILQRLVRGEEFEPQERRTK